MKIKAKQLCSCGHVASAHTAGVFPCADPDGVYLEEIHRKTFGRCGKCESIQADTKCMRFELNNLDLVEYLAEQRGLV